MRPAQRLSVLVSDLEHAGFYGVTATPAAQVSSGGIITATAAELRQPGPDDGCRTRLRPARGRPRLRSQLRGGPGHARRGG